MRRSIVILGKPPHPGATKTRLVPPLTFAEAANLSSGLLRDTVTTALELGWEQATVVHPDTPDASESLRAFLPSEVSLQSQIGRGLEAALIGAFAAQFQAGFDLVVLIGSDAPTLPRDVLDEAAQSLTTHDLVLGPSADGGYYLIGMTREHRGVFDRITWSTDLVFEQTLERARAHGLHTHVLREWYDIDTVTDLIRLREHLRVLPPQTAAATRRELARLALDGLLVAAPIRHLHERPASASRWSRRAGVG
jgi:rSAM/selenodomain-associated transferase 1